MSLAYPAPRPIETKRPFESRWPVQGNWTYEDYCRLPEDGWTYEVIEGELLMSPAPRTIHQRCKGKIYVAMLLFVEKHDLGLVLDAPHDVMLEKLATPVQPDILFIAKERLHIVKPERTEGAPDLIVEVLSPWNWMADRQQKFNVYAEAGVKEYWIVDPEQRTIELFQLRGHQYMLTGKYGVKQSVRSKILQGFQVKVKEVCPAQ